VRATCHGISAAAGKLGAVFGTFVLIYLQDSFCSNDVCNDNATAEQIDHGLQVTFMFCGVLGMVGYIQDYYFYPP
jgi:hypothetical protein